MWTMDSADKKVYSYNLLLSDDSTLSALTVRPKDIIGFDAERDSYQLGVASTVTRATVTGTTNHPGARVAYSGTDASSGTRGHQVDLSADRNPVTVTVTAEDGTTQDYTVSINRGVADDYGWNAGLDLDGLATTIDDPPTGIAEHNGIIWVSSFYSNNVLAYRQDGLPIRSRDFTASANSSMYHMFTDSQTIWIVDGIDNRVHAYRLSDGVRQESRDIALHTDNDYPAGIWSDGATMWVADNTDHKLYAYSLDGGARQESREFDLDSGNNPVQGHLVRRQHRLGRRPCRPQAIRLRPAEREPTDRPGLQHTQRGREQQPSRHHIGRQHHVGPMDTADNKAYTYNMPLLPPANVQAAIGDRRIAITWDDPQRSAITGYQYRVSSNDGDSWDPDWTTMPGSNARTTTFTVRNLANNFEHVIEVRALEGAKPSEAARFAAIPMGPPSVPLMPENPDTVAGDQTLYLSWYKPAEDPRAPVTSFDARYRPYGSSRSWRNATSVSVEQTARIIYDQTIEGLDNRQPYEVQVAAVNSVGRGDWATASGVPQAPPTQPENPDDADEDLNVGALGGHWTDGPGNDNSHTDSQGPNTIFACAEPQSFRVFWHGPGNLSPGDPNPPADEWQAHLITRGRAGAVSYQFRPEYRDPRFTGLYATVQLYGPGFVTVRVRGRFGDNGWGVWSDPMGFYCADEANRPSSTQEAQQAPEGNQPATGQPTISGTPAVGETLTADTSDIEDVNGLTNAEFTYQWVRYDGSSDTDIAGATGATYTVTDGDTGQLIKVRITFTDDADNQESISSYYVYVQTPQPLYGGFDADTVPGSHDGEAAFTFQVHFSESPELGWEAVRDHVLQVTNGDVTGARRTTGGSNIRWDITLEPAGNNDVTVTLPATTDCAAQGAVCTSSGKMLSNQTGITVPGPVEAQQQQQEETPANTAATGQPTINGTARVGETLTVDTSGIADEDGLDDAAFSYQWIRNDGNADSDISGATGSTHTLVADDEGKTIKVRVSFTDDGGNEETLTSAATAAVAAAPPTNNEATGAPAISGTVKVGHVLTADITGIADQDGLDNADFDYQWLADDSPIPGATASAYLLVAADRGRALAVRVSFTDDGDSDESLTSAATAAVTTSPLTVSLENEPDTPHDGQNTFTFQLRFSEEFYVSYLTLKDDAFTVDGGEVANARRMDRDSITPNIHWAITVRPNGDGDVTITLPETTDCNAEGAICTEDQRMLSNCDAEGAICTEDQRMLSNPLELTVSGPSS